MGNKYGQPLQTLVTSGNVAPIAAGNTVFDLADGQIGVFDAKTRLSIDGTGNQKEVFFAVGVHTNGSITDAVYSKPIQLRRVDSLTFRPHTPGQDQQSVFWGYCGLCDTEYTLKVHFENQKIYRNQGFVQFGKTYSTKTDCCGPCDAPTIPSGDCNLVTKALVERINSDPLQLLTAVPVQVTTDASGNYVSHAAIADIDAFIATQQAAVDGGGDRVCSGIELTANEDAIRTNAGLNRNYFYPRGTSFSIFPKSGFTCNYKIEATVAPAFAEGNGADIEDREYRNATNNLGRGSAYYTSNTTNADIEKVTRANPSESYDQFMIENVLKSSSAWLEYENDVATAIAVPAASNLTLAGLATLLDNLFDSEEFSEIASDVAAADADTSVQEPTSGKGVDDDGIV